MSIKYRLALDNSSDARAFCILYNSIYSKEITSKYYKWQFFNTPFPSYLVFATENSKVIGSVGVQVKSIMPNSRKVLSVLDMMVDSLYRGKGVFSSLIKQAMLMGEKFNPLCAIVLANKNGMDAICGALDWYCVTKLETMQKELKHFKTPELLENISNQIPLYEKFLNLFPNNLFHIQHTIEHFNWRFQNHPTFDYIYTCIKTGYSISKVFTNPITFDRYGDIIEIVGKDSKSIKKVANLTLRKLNISNKYNLGFNWLWIWLLWGR